MHTDHMLENEKMLSGIIPILGITSISVDFYGGGDSGQINEVEIESEIPEVAEYKVTVWLDGGKEFIADFGWQDKPDSRGQLTLEEFIRRHVDEALQDTNIDWYNNDGGSGTWMWTAASGIEFHIDINETVSNRAYESSRKLGFSSSEMAE